MKNASQPIQSPTPASSPGKLLIFCAPSGSGKSTIIASLMAHTELNLHFSVSATTRPPRGQERDGVEYLFLSPEEFRQKICEDAFIEYEEVYHDRFYGTLKSQVETQLARGENVVFDVDVNGGTRLKHYFSERALSIFIHPGSVEVLRKRLLHRGTDSPEVIQQRLERADYELSFAPRFDRVVLNDVLEKAVAETLATVTDFLK